MDLASNAETAFYFETAICRAWNCKSSSGQVLFAIACVNSLMRTVGSSQAIQVREHSLSALSIFMMFSPFTARFSASDSETRLRSSCNGTTPLSVTSKARASFGIVFVEINDRAHKELRG